VPTDRYELVSAQAPHDVPRPHRLVETACSVDEQGVTSGVASRSFWAFIRSTSTKATASVSLSCSARSRNSMVAARLSTPVNGSCSPSARGPPWLALHQSTSSMESTMPAGPSESWARPRRTIRRMGRADSAGHHRECYFAGRSHDLISAACELPGVSFLSRRAAGMASMWIPAFKPSRTWHREFRIGDRTVSRDVGHSERESFSQPTQESFFPSGRVDRHFRRPIPPRRDRPLPCRWRSANSRHIRRAHAVFVRRFDVHHEPSRWRCPVSQVPGSSPFLQHRHPLVHDVVVVVGVDEIE